MQPVEPEGSGGLSSGLIVALIVGGAAAVVAAGFFVFQALGGSETTTTTVVAAPTTTTTTVVAAATTTTTTESEKEPNPFVGWWTATDSDDSHLDLRVGSDATFMYWDSASGVCRPRGFGHSPQTWSGVVAFQEDGATMTGSGLRACYPYGQPNREIIGAARADWLYDAEADMLEFAPDGVRYTRSPLPPESGDSNPFVGAWEGTDSDGTRYAMEISPDGAWQLLDTRSGGCESMGLTYATWSAEGIGTFNLDGTPSFQVVTTTFCHPVDGDAVPRSENVVLRFEYRADDDTVALLLFLETIFTRVP